MQSGLKIPGYSGHIPLKLDIVGQTTGETNKQAGENFRYVHKPSMIDAGSTMMMQQKIANTMRSNSVDGSAEKTEKGTMRGNMSKTSVSWMNGPMHNIRNQCIPGYTGFVSGINSENLYGKSYSNNTAKSFKGKILRGFDHEPQKRFVSQNQKIFKETASRRIADRPEFRSRRDYLEYMMSMNLETAAVKNNQTYLQKTGTFNHYRGTYHDATDTTVSPKKHARDLKGSPLQIHQDSVQIKPRLIESGLAAKPEFQALSPAFKQMLARDDGDQAMRLPIVGYAGHRKGEKSENMFAKSYRQTTIAAQQNYRKALASTTAAK